ncbi:phage major capsid family protein [Nitrobacter sp. JJSN]|uniref:phage major capsid family protein n=1 Tax=Nitrobacter sp. JJSN TaxID=3453033 RepID=UPI003F7622D9
MLQSVKISRRQSEIRQSLAGLVGKTDLSEDETRSIESLDNEYRSNETKYRGALIVEDTERREAKGDLETRSDKDFSDLIGKFELRQVALHLDEGAKIDGATAEVIEELRSQGGYRGVPVPWQALEKRSGETIASGTPSPVSTAPIIDRIFADSVAGKMGTRFINIAQGLEDYPITSSSVTGGWAASETGAVAGPTVYSTANRSLAPNSTYGIQMKVTRKALKQSGTALEDAVRRDMNGCLAVGMDKAVFQGAGSSGEPAGVFVGSYGITSTAISAAASWNAFRAAVTRFIVANAASGPGSVNLLLRPEIYDEMDGALFTNTAISQWDKLVANVGNVVLSSNALAAPTGSPLASKALLTTTVNGVAPIFVGTWGAIDLIRDVYSDAASGGLRLTALATMDVTVSRAEQLQILTGIQ